MRHISKDGINLDNERIANPHDIDSFDTFQEAIDCLWDYRRTVDVSGFVDGKYTVQLSWSPQNKVFFYRLVDDRDSLLAFTIRKNKNDMEPIFYALNYTASGSVYIPRDQQEDMMKSSQKEMIWKMWDLRHNLPLKG